MDKLLLLLLLLGIFPFVFFQGVGESLWELGWGWGCVPSVTLRALQALGCPPTWPLPPLSPHVHCQQPKLTVTHSLTRILSRPERLAFGPLSHHDLEKIQHTDPHSERALILTQLHPNHPHIPIPPPFILTFITLMPCTGQTVMFPGELSAL